MIPFEEIRLSDREWIQPLLDAAGTQNADDSFVNLYAWGSVYGLRAAKVGERLVTVMTGAHGTLYSHPIGAGTLVPVLEAIAEDAAERGLEPVLSGASPAEAEEIARLWHGTVKAECRRERWDYLYSAEKLATLAGKKLHGKRNHIHRFEEAFPNWKAEPVTAENLPLCRSVAGKWLEEAEKNRGGEYGDETAALEVCFGHFEALSMEGCLLTVSGQPAAFTMGSFLRPDTVDVHFEKALGDYPGAYAMVCRAFARQLRERHPEVVWLNREDDMGLENLRKAKESYYPDAMVEKMNVTLL